MLVNSRIAALVAEATTERLARTGKAMEPRRSVRSAIGRGFLAIGAAIAASR
jgi:hypothetical protein